MFEVRGEPRGYACPWVVKRPGQPGPGDRWTAAAFKRVQRGQWRGIVGLVFGLVCVGAHLACCVFFALLVNAWVSGTCGSLRVRVTASLLHVVQKLSTRGLRGGRFDPNSTIPEGGCLHRRAVWQWQSQRSCIPDRSSLTVYKNPTKGGTLVSQPLLQGRPPQGRIAATREL